MLVNVDGVRQKFSAGLFDAAFAAARCRFRAVDHPKEPPANRPGDVSRLQ